MLGHLHGVEGVCDYSITSADDSSAVVSLAAAVGTRHMVVGIVASYDLAPATGADRILTVVWTLKGVSKTLRVAVGEVTAGLYPVIATFPRGFIVGDDNTAITATLTASGTAGNLGTVGLFHL